MRSSVIHILNNIIIARHFDLVDLKKNMKLQ